MMALYLLDSVVLIDVLRGVPQAVRWVRSLKPGQGVISVITRAEVLTGGSEEEEAAGQELCDLFECVAIDAAVADLAARLRRERRWKLPDAFQAALAQNRGWRLVTRNERDFRPDRDAFVLVPYRFPAT